MTATTNSNTPWHQVEHERIARQAAFLRRYGVPLQPTDISDEDVGEDEDLYGPQIDAPSTPPPSSCYACGGLHDIQRCPAIRLLLSCSDEAFQAFKAVQPPDDDPPPLVSVGSWHEGKALMRQYIGGVACEQRPLASHDDQAYYFRPLVLLASPQAAYLYETRADGTLGRLRVQMVNTRAMRRAWRRRAA